MNRISDILAECLEDIAAGKTTVEECLARHADIRGELEPLLRLGLDVGKLPRITPDTAYKTWAKASLMEQIRNEQDSRSGQRGFSWSGIFGPAWIRITAVVLAVVLVLSGAGTGTVFASSDSLPGETLYTVKTGWEDVRTWLETDAGEESALQIEFAGRRIQEMQSLLENDPADIDIAVSGYGKNLERALEKAGETQDTGILNTVAGKVLEHLGLLDALEDEYDQETGSEIGLAEELAVTSQIRAIRAIAGEEPGTAANLTVQVMEQRMQRASGLYAHGRANQGEQALGQFLKYSELCDEISAAAGDNATVAECLGNCYRSLQKYYSEITDKVPPGLAEKMENAFQNMQGHRYGQTDETGTGAQNGQGQGNGTGNGNLGQGNGSAGQGNVAQTTDEGIPDNQPDDGSGTVATTPASQEPANTPDAGQTAVPGQTNGNSPENPGGQDQGQGQDEDDDTGPQSGPNAG